jgi:hypothetical protein
LNWVYVLVFVDDDALDSAGEAIAKAIVCRQNLDRYLEDRRVIEVAAPLE